MSTEIFVPFQKDDIIVLKGISQKGKSIVGTWGNEWIVKGFKERVGFSIEKKWIYVETIKRLAQSDWWEGVWINVVKDENFSYELENETVAQRE